MKRTFKGFAFGVLAGFLGITVAGLMVNRNLALEGTYTYLRLFNEALSLIRGSYVDEVKTDSLMKGAYEGMLSELDPASEYLTPEEYADDVAWRNRAPGVPGSGDTGLRVARKEGAVIVISVRPGSDADEKGISPGDHVRRVGERPSRDMSLQQIEAALTGSSGKSVAVSLLRREEPHKLDTELKFKEPAPADITMEIVDAKQGIAVLQVQMFGEKAAAEIAAALSRAEKQKVQRLLIDLRGNAWGEISEAVKAAALFVGDGVIAGLKARGGEPDPIRGSGAKSGYSGMVAILLNGATAEAAELFAAALKDARGATLMGETSFGVGAQQDLIPLKNGSWLKLSVRKYVSPSGSAWHGVGLKPDVTVAASRDGAKPADRLKGQLTEAIEQVKKLKPATAGASPAPGGTLES